MPSLLGTAAAKADLSLYCVFTPLIIFYFFYNP
jgi:hypothetical protein